MSRRFISERKVRKEREEAEWTEGDVEGRCRPDTSLLTPNKSSREDVAHRACPPGVSGCSLSPLLWDSFLWLVQEGLALGQGDCWGKAWELQCRDCATAGAGTECAP